VTFEIDEGQSDWFDLSGRMATARVFLDDGTSDEQARELTAIVEGQKGGTFEIIGGLISTWLPVEKTSINVSGTATSSP
jgi:hypothetical protein